MVAGNSELGKVSTVMGTRSQSGDRLGGLAGLVAHVSAQAAAGERAGGLAGNLGLLGGDLNLAIDNSNSNGLGVSEARELVRVEVHQVVGLAGEGNTVLLDNEGRVVLQEHPLKIGRHRDLNQRYTQ